MSRSRLLSLIGTAAALGVIGLAFACTPRARYGPRPVIAPSPDSVSIVVSDPVPTHGWTRKRLARDCGGCKVEVWIGAYRNGQNADPAHPPATPLKIARIINTGGFRTQMYGLERLTQYDLVFQRNDSTGLGEYVLEPITRFMGRDKVKGDVNKCPGHERLGQRPDADFRGCDDPPPSIPRLAAMGPSLGPLIRALTQGFAAGEDPAWWACGSGCCTAKAVYPS